MLPIYSKGKHAPSFFGNINEEKIQYISLKKLNVSTHKLYTYYINIEKNSSLINYHYIRDEEKTSFLILKMK
ncbi:hypothetical protein PFAG_04566 [Plasmodium falciparum Santa Lucia]|uniref:Uncharacterized protein n=6 Tax=Plasmodium falciparum TaxID=5833 RepID=W7K0K1_PLAFO|nr:hypothetical protein PFFVO_04170 [Plasmodium falciparum Vietnam Oak-Knoll (FVO)]ETW34783.1 hypothetical protein PFTANZ_04515 [Plasmodium falciparum Tanzania (2000708)]EUR66314.1 hypothetical protein PFBG_04601 [Plasmodium falciparum 7G8]EUT81353.1 hypothetical protein PFAG_04566 [Plasmodium falciparum Santa Lucia]EWC86844.1 hypothetical protein PFNF54_04397 [Plasmodium falciparum NF54]